MATIQQLKDWFRKGLKPTEAQFHALIDSYHRKGDLIPQSNIEGLDQLGQPVVIAVEGSAVYTLPAKKILEGVAVTTVIPNQNIKIGYSLNGGEYIESIVEPSEPLVYREDVFRVQPLDIYLTGNFEIIIYTR